MPLDTHSTFCPLTSCRSHSQSWTAWSCPCGARQRVVAQRAEVGIQFGEIKRGRQRRRGDDRAGAVQLARLGNPFLRSSRSRPVIRSERGCLWIDILEQRFRLLSILILPRLRVAHSFIFPLSPLTPSHPFEPQRALSLAIKRDSTYPCPARILLIHRSIRWIQVSKPWYPQRLPHLQSPPYNDHSLSLVKPLTRGWSATRPAYHMAIPTTETCALVRILASDPIPYN